MAEQKTNPTGVLDQVRELDAKASPGPWHFDYTGGRPWMIVAQGRAIATVKVQPGDMRTGADRDKANAQLAATARNALLPLVEALVAQDDFYAHSAHCVDEDCREEERLEGVAMSKRHVALADLREQLEEKASA